MIPAGAWSSWVVSLRPSSRGSLLGSIDQQVPAPWYWVDLEGADRFAIEIGTPSDDAQEQTPHDWVTDAVSANVIASAARRRNPLLCAPELFPSDNCPAPWCDLLADTSARALKLLLCSETGQVTDSAALATELVSVYRSLAPDDQLIACAQWHLGWLTGSGPPSRHRSDTAPSPVRTAPFIRQELAAALRSWSDQIPQTPSVGGPQPAWLPMVARLAHIHAVRLCLGDNGATEREALAILLDV